MIERWAPGVSRREGYLWAKGVEARKAVTRYTKA